MTLNTFPLRSLRLSPLNVRKVKPTGIEALAADIAAHGVLQNLIGYEHDDKVMICAGGRRYRALKRLQKDKTITPSFEVPVDVRPIEEAVELSLAENVQREAMHPADAILAYRDLVEGGMDAEQIAIRFGASIDHVRRLLRLSGLNPKLIAAMKRDELSLGSAKALALCEDHSQQWQAFKQVGDNQRSLRNLLTDEKLSCQSALFELVGHEAYANAGGTLTCDLFSNDDEAFADDTGLVHSLADIRLGELAEIERAAGWGEVIVSIDRPEEFYSLPKLYPDSERDLSEEEQARLRAVGKQIAAFANDGVPYYDDRIRNLETEQRSIEAERRFFGNDQKAEAKLYLFVGYHGVERYPVGKPQRASRHDDAKPKPDYPAALISDLGTIRTLAVREAVATNPALAFDILLDHMLGQLLGQAYSFEQALDIKAEPGNVEAKPELIEAATIRPLDEIFSDLFPALQVGDRFETIEAMSGDDKMRILAFCVASQITSSDLSGAKGDAISKVQERAKLRLEDVWRPNAAFFRRLTKPVMLALLVKHCGEEAMQNCRNLKKSDLADACAERLAAAGYFPPNLQPVDDSLPWEVDEEPAAIAAE